IALLVDVSGSMRIGPKLGLARQMVSRLVHELEDGRDEAALFTFDASLHEEQPFTAQPSSIESALSSADPWGTTSLYDAVATTARRLAKRAPAHGAVVVLTDGIDTSSVLSPEEVSGVASSIDVPVFIVMTVPPVDVPGFSGRDGDKRTADVAGLEDLAAWT